MQVCCVHPPTITATFFNGDFLWKLWLAGFPVFVSLHLFWGVQILGCDHSSSETLPLLSPTCPVTFIIIIDMFKVA